MSDQGKAQDLKVPQKTQDTFPELIEMIQKSESMDQEERQYWIDALPVMTPEQVENLRDILESEQRQIQKAKESHRNSLQGIAKKNKVAFDSEEYKEKKRIIREAEAKEQENREEHLDNILDEMEEL